MGFLFSKCSSFKDPKKDAWVCAQDVVESELKSPSSAKFPWYSERFITDLGNNEYMISAYVDSDNSFGAKIRSEFTVTLTLTEDGYTNASVTIG